MQPRTLTEAIEVAIAHQNCCGLRNLEQNIENSLNFDQAIISLATTEKMDSNNKNNPNELTKNSFCDFRNNVKHLTTGCYSLRRKTINDHENMQQNNTSPPINVYRSNISNSHTYHDSVALKKFSKKFYVISHNLNDLP